MDPAEVKKEINALLKEGVLERKDGGIFKRGSKEDSKGKGKFTREELAARKK
jgi:hypothetical protein